MSGPPRRRSVATALRVAHGVYERRVDSSGIVVKASAALAAPERTARACSTLVGTRSSLLVRHFLSVAVARATGRWLLRVWPGSQQLCKSRLLRRGAHWRGYGHWCLLSAAGRTSAESPWHVRWKLPLERKRWWIASLKASTTKTQLEALAWAERATADAICTNEIGW